MAQDTNTAAANGEEKEEKEEKEERPSLGNKLQTSLAVSVPRGASLFGGAARPDSRETRRLSGGQ